MALDTDAVVSLYEQHATRQYGREAVNQMEHALQCAHLAEQAAESQATVVAALLHDIGHLLAIQHPAPPAASGEQDDLHQFIALPFLRATLPDAVLEPIRLHVDAKRYLCATERAYEALLSPESRRSLALQGGPLSPEQAAAFMAQPYAAEAVRLRRYDDQAKVPGAVTPKLEHYAALLRTVAADFARAAPH